MSEYTQQMELLLKAIELHESKPTPLLEAFIAILSARLGFDLGTVAQEINKPKAA